jgi:hypothetical protein
VLNAGAKVPLFLAFPNFSRKFFCVPAPGCPNALADTLLQGKFFFARLREGLKRHPFGAKAQRRPQKIKRKARRAGQGFPVTSFLNRAGTPNAK